MIHRNLVIVGGGISGLAVAHRASQLLPATSRITVLEKSPRFGGWMGSRKQRLPDGTEVVLESGPRTMRPVGAEGLTAVKLVEDLGLSDQLITVPKSAPAAKNRFIYYPDRLNKLPHSLLSLGTALQQPALQNFLSALFTEAFKSGRKGKGALDADESVDAFIRRRLGPGVADNLISAMVHGIYAGDSHQLSVRALFHSLWQMERQAGSITVGMMMRRFTDQAKDSAERFERTRDSLTQSSRNKLRNASVWSLKGGLEGLSTRLVERLEAQPNVRLLNNAEVESIDNSSPSEVQIKYTRANQSKTLSASNLVCALPSRALAKLLPSLPHLDYNPSVDVGLVNLVYRNPKEETPSAKSPTKRLLPVEGFGYLIPQSTNLENNPHRALGCIFDSDVMPPVDESSKTHTKLTVLLGGHHYSDMSIPLPSAPQLIEQTQETLERHLGITQQPELTHSQMQRSCIPQYTVGHVDRMTDLHLALVEQQARTSSRISIAGASYTGVSVNDCIYHAFALAEGIAGPPPAAAASNSSVTGLEGYLAARS